MDKLDDEIIKILQENSRLSYAKIGKRVNLSEAAVRKRITKLKAKGIIKKFTIELNMPHQANAIILISLSPSTSSSTISQKLCEIKGIKSIHEVTGQYDIFVDISAPNVVEVNKSIEEIRGLSGITNTNTMIILKSWN